MSAGAEGPGEELQMDARTVVLTLCAVACGFAAGWLLNEDHDRVAQVPGTPPSHGLESSVTPPLLGRSRPFDRDFDRLREDIRSLRDDLQAARVAPTSQIIDTIDARLGEALRRAIAEDRLRTERPAALAYADLLIQGSEQQLAQLRQKSSPYAMIEEVQGRLAALRAQKARIEEAKSLGEFRQMAQEFPLEYSAEQDRR